MIDGTVRRAGTTGLRRWRRALTRHRRWWAAACAALAVGAGVHALRPPAPATDGVQVAARDLPAGHLLVASDLVGAAWPAGTRPDGVLSPSAAQGQVLATAIRRGEPVTDRRVTGPGLLAGQPPGTVAVSVRLTDPASLVLLTPGRRVNLLAGPAAQAGLAADAGSADTGSADAGSAGGGGAATETGAGTAAIDGGRGTVLAAGALVLAVPRTVGDFGSSGGSEWLGDTGGGAGGAAGSESGAGAAGGATSGVVVVAVRQDTAARLAAAAGNRSITAVLTADP
jgi:SAF domain